MLRFVLIFAGLVGGAWLLEKSTSSKNNSKIGGIPKGNISKKYLTYFYRKSDISSIKRSISQSINAIKSKYKKFKIGKTGNEVKRAHNHSKFDEMYLLCVSPREDFIITLEEYYLDKYITDPKNVNINRGSAGQMVSYNGQYYLYVVVR